MKKHLRTRKYLKAPVTQVLDGGLCVNVDEARVFIPASLVSDTYEKDLSKYADQEIEFVITEFNPRRRRIIGNRKQLLLAEKAEKQKELIARESMLAIQLKVLLRTLQISVHSSIWAEQTDFFTSPRCPGAE